MVAFEAVELCLALRPEQLTLRRLRHARVRSRMRVLQALGLATRVQSLHGKLANRLQHQQARLVEFRHLAQQALVRELLEPCEHFHAELLGGAADLFGLFQACAPREDGEALHEELQRWFEHVVAPRDRASESLLA